MKNLFGGVSVVALFVVTVAVALLVGPVLVMYLWNWLMPTCSGCPKSAFAKRSG
jgi:phage shock protein PspC (stress-responsive transcriptional regulator)